MEWLWISLGVLATLLLAVLYGVHYRLMRHYIPLVTRIFQEKPIFIMPFGQPVPDAEDIALKTPDGLTLQACYLATSKPRKGVLLFGLEFGSNRWACVPYCEFLREAGYDIFTFEMRGQGKSPAQPGYEPLQWVTEFEVIDFQTALAYLKARPDRDSRGIGFFGLSKGGSAGIIAAAQDPFIRCCVVDGIFGVLSTMVPYMRQWIFIYTKMPWLARVLPTWYFRHAARLAMYELQRIRGCRYPSLERRLAKIAPRPLLMVHGGADNYIKPDMARALFLMAREPKEFWLVENAKHNQSFHLAAEEYKRRVLAFFDQHLTSLPVSAVNGILQSAVPEKTSAPV